jgi:hypothetical protein
MAISAATTLAPGARKTVAPARDISAWGREGHDAAATRQLHFSYWPVLTLDADARVPAGLLRHWWQARSAARAAARPVPGFRLVGGVMTKADRFFIGHAASALANLQSDGIAGSSVIPVSMAGLADPLLPLYVVSQLQSRGVSLIGVTVDAPWYAGR